MSHLRKIFLSKPALILEFILLCIVLPSVIIFFKLAPMMFVFLWSAAVYCYLSLRIIEGKPDWKALWKVEAVTWEAMKPVLIRWVFATLAMGLLCYFYAPERFLFLPQERPYVVLVLIFVYPIASALPQEFIFCSFFFRRYGTFFGTGLKMIIASAIVFAYAHVLFINWVAPTLSLIAGYIFARTYQQSKSLALVTIEHGLYGNSLFIIGLGWYFYGGAVGVQ